MALEGVLRGALAGVDLGDGFHVLPGQGNALAAETDAGVVLVDAGSVRAAPSMIEHLRSVSSAPVHAICYSHGHIGYNAAVGTWLAHASERGEPPPRLVAHENLPRRYARYRETLHLQARMAAVQFPSREGAPWERMLEAFRMTDPGEVFADALLVVDGDRRVEARWAPSETDDAIALWFPDDGLLYGGAATPGDAIPNIGTPLRTQRFTVRWADTLERLAALGATTLVTEFGPVVRGEAVVHERLARTAEALRWLREAVVERMNRGMSEAEVLADLVDLLAACRAFAGVDRARLHEVARDVEVGYLATGEPPVRPALVVMRGELRVLDAGGAVTDVVDATSESRVTVTYDFALDHFQEEAVQGSEMCIRDSR